MEIKIITKKENPLLKRTEVHFLVEYDKNVSTPSRLEIRKKVENLLKKNIGLVIIKKIEPRAGTHTAAGLANVYNSVQQAKRIEPVHYLKRNAAPQKPEEEQK